MTEKSQISKRALSIKPSLTLEISAKAKALKAEGKNICSLSAGEPDFDTPEFITFWIKNPLLSSKVCQFCYAHNTTSYF